MMKMVDELYGGLIGGHLLRYGRINGSVPLAGYVKPYPNAEHGMPALSLSEYRDINNVMPARTYASSGVNLLPVGLEAKLTGMEAEL